MLVSFDRLLKFQERRYIIMDNDSGALILLIVLMVSAFLLILIRLQNSSTISDGKSNIS